MWLMRVYARKLMATFGTGDPSLAALLYLARQHVVLRLQVKLQDSQQLCADADGRTALLESSHAALEAELITRQVVLA